MNTKRFKKIKKVLSKRQPDLTVLMDNVHKAHNLAAIARSCDAVGIQEIHAVALNKEAEITQKTSGGVRKWVKLTQFNSSEKAVSDLKNKGFHVVSAHLTNNSLDYRDIDYTKKTAVVVGAELYGVSPGAQKLSDDFIYIPMHGMTQSLNVSVACALILFEAERQRKTAGLYDNIRLDKKKFSRALFELTYPDIAAFCKNKKISYPRIDTETGVLLEDFKTGKYF